MRGQGKQACYWLLVRVVGGHRRAAFAVQCVQKRLHTPTITTLPQATAVNNNAAACLAK